MVGMEHCCVSASVESKYKPYFTREMKEKFARCSESIVRLFFDVLIQSRASLQRSTVKLQIVGTVTFLNARRGLKESPNKLLAVRFC